jgi:hypothetical protein
MSKNVAGIPMPKICTGAPPVDTSYRMARGSYYDELFNSMKKGSWFLIDKKEEAKYRAAIVKRGTGKFSVRRSTQKDKFVVIKVKA